MSRRGTAIAAITGSMVAVLLGLTVGSSTAGGPKCLGKTATIVRGDGDNDIQGTPGADVIIAGGGQDFVEAHGNKDRVCGEGGSDLIFTGPGADKIAAGKGRDEIHGVGGNDDLRGGEGDDSGIVPHQGSTINAGLYGEEGNDELNGNPGVDLCDGGDGTDALDNCEVFPCGVAAVGKGLGPCKDPPPGMREA